MPDILLADRYRLGPRIGTGGSAQVFEARDERLDRRVAVKVLDDAAATTADPAARQRFESESRTAAQFVHPNAVTVFDAGSDEGMLYVVMELVTGGSLAELLARSGPVPSLDVARIGAQVASALAAAHAAGIIHRDVKPSNVLLDERGNAKLADFGIARRLDEIGESFTSTGMVMGTRHYVSPEQARGEPLGATTDIFSLGVTLYEATTGTRPPDAIDRGTEDRLDVRAVVPDADPGLAAVIERATVIPVAERYGSATAMADALTNTTARVAPVTPDGTAIMPEHLRPVADGAGAATTPMTHPAPPPPAAAGLPADLGEERRRRRQTRRVAIGVVLAVVLGVAVLVALTRDNGTSDAGSALTTTVAPVLDPVATTTAAAPTTAAPTTTPTTAAPTTATPTTVAAPPTVPVTSAPAGPVELIPGFPLPADIDEFLATLQDDPELAGARGKDLAKELDKLLGEAPGRFDDRRDALIAHVEEWRDAGELDDTIAAEALVLLEALDGPTQRGGKPD